MKDFKVLVDLSPIMSGNMQYSGVPQDTRSLFKLFARAETIHPTGLICSLDRDSALIKFKKYKNKVQTAYAYTNYFLKLDETIAGQLSEDHVGILKTAKLVLSSYFQTIPLAIRTFKKNFHLSELDKNYDDYIWRKAFDSLIETQFKEAILKQPFVITNFSKHIQTNRILLNLNPATLHTPGMDFAIFQSRIPQSPAVSKGTIPIIRFHDTVPLRLPDTLTHFNEARVFAKSVSKSAQHATFVCNSESLREELIKLIPMMENRTFVVPPALTIEDSMIDKSKDAIATIVKARRSSLKKYSINVPEVTAQTDYSNYIICVSTIDPRKNYLSLVRAWERIRYQHDDKLKLIVVGSLGTKSDSVIRAMKPHMMAGNIIHLEKVPIFELGTLYACAKAFVLPTYHEGFGCTPVEAMHAGCPVIVSDIPATRWALGDAALYCDPYDVSSITDAILRLLYSEESPALTQELIMKGYANAKKYSAASITNQWYELFEKLKTQQK